MDEKDLKQAALAAFKRSVMGGADAGAQADVKPEPEEQPATPVERDGAAASAAEDPSGPTPPESGEGSTEFDATPADGDAGDAEAEQSAQAGEPPSDDEAVKTAKPVEAASAKTAAVRGTAGVGKMPKTGMRGTSARKTGTVRDITTLQKRRAAQPSAQAEAADPVETDSPVKDTPAADARVSSSTTETRSAAGVRAARTSQPARPAGRGLLLLSVALNAILLVALVYLMAVQVTNLQTALDSQKRELVEIQQKTMANMAESLQLIYKFSRFKAGAYVDAKKGPQSVVLVLDDKGSVVKTVVIPIELKE